MKNKKAFEITLVSILGILLVGGTSYLAISNIKKVEDTASLLAAKAYADELETICKDSELSFPIYYNDGHHYWKVDSNYEVTVDEDHHEMTPKVCK